MRQSVTKRRTVYFFFFNDTATTEIYTLSLHDALPISSGSSRTSSTARACATGTRRGGRWSRCLSASTEPTRCGSRATGDRKSTRLNSSHANTSYAVFSLKKKIIIYLFFLFLILFHLPS